MRSLVQGAVALALLAILPAQSTTDDRVTISGLDVRPFTLPDRDRPYTIAETFTVRNHVTFAPGAAVSVAAGRTVTFVGEVSAPPRQHIFRGDGEVSLYSQRSAVYGEWFGAVGYSKTANSGAAFTKASRALTNGGIIRPISDYWIDCSDTEPGILISGAVAKSFVGSDRAVTTFRPLRDCASQLIRIDTPGGDVGNFTLAAGHLGSSTYRVSGIHCQRCQKMTMRDVKTFGFHDPFWLEHFGASNFVRIDSTNHTGTIRVGGGSQNADNKQVVAISNFENVNSFPAHNLGQCMTFDSGTSELAITRLVGAGGSVCVHIVNTSPGGHRPEGIRFFGPNLDASPGGNFVVRAGAVIELFDGSLGQTAIPNETVAPNGSLRLLADGPMEAIDGVIVDNVTIRGGGAYGIEVHRACNVSISDNKIHANAGSYSGGAGIMLWHACGLIEVKGNHSGVTDRPGAVWGNASGQQSWGLILGDGIPYDTYTSNALDGATRTFKTRISVRGNVFGGNSVGPIQDLSDVMAPYKQITDNMLQ